MSLKNLSVVPGNNTLSPPFGAPESSTKLKDFNDLWRYLASVTRSLAAPVTIASAATTDLGASDETIQTISGVTTITSFGTVSAGIWKLVTFSGALTLTHNATSLILLGGANRTTVAGDCGLYVSLGSGNWKEYFYSPIGAYQPLDAQLTTLAGITATQATDLAAVSTFMGTVLDDADGATARATLGAEPTLLRETVVAAATTSVSLSGLDIATHKGYRIVAEIINALASDQFIRMHVNGLTTDTDYYVQSLEVDGATVSGARSNDAIISRLIASNRTYAVIEITRMSGDYTMAASRNTVNTGSVIRSADYRWSKTATVSNITSISFASGATDGIGVGSTFRVYRMDK